MSKIRVMITDGLSAELAGLLDADHFQVDVEPTPDADGLRRAVDTCDAIAIRSATRLSADVLRQAGRLRLVVRGGVGVDNIDIAAASARGIAVANTPNANTVATAELTMAMLLALSRNLVAAHNSVASGKWERSRFKGVELFGKTLGLLGFGRIGREVAARAHAFGMQTLAYDPYLPESVFQEHQTPSCSLDELLQRSDYLSLHLPENSDTRQIIGTQALSKVRPGIRVVNCARGGLLDEHAVAAALDSGKVAGVATDVYAQEPPGTDHPLVGRPDVIHVPHLGASTAEAQARVATEVAQVITSFFVEKKMTTVLNKEHVQGNS